MHSSDREEERRLTGAISKASDLRQGELSGQETVDLCVDFFYGGAMPDAKELRQKAAQYRRAADIRTSGGQAADRRLIELALKLEQQARNLDHTGTARIKWRDDAWRSPMLSIHARTDEKPHS